MSSVDVPRRRPAVPYATADAAALIVFVVAGIRSHHEIGALDLFLRNAVPLEVAWFAVAAAVGTYRRLDLRTLVWNWIVAVPVAIIVRSLWVGSPDGARLLTFVGIGLLFTLLFLLVGRGVVGAIHRGRSRSSAERDSMTP